MANQINVGIQRQSYEAHENYEAIDSEAENSNADASLADDSAGANTGGNPNVVAPHIEGESVNQAAPEMVATNNLLNRYGISDGIMIQRPEYTFNNRAAPAQQNDPSPICPDQTDLGSSGVETPPLTTAKPLEKPSVASVAKSATDSQKAVNMNAAPPVSHDSADYRAAHDYGVTHGYSDIKIDKLASLLHYQNPQFKPAFGSASKWLSDQLDATPVNRDGSFNLLGGMQHMAHLELLRSGGPVLPDNRYQSAALDLSRGGFSNTSSGAATNYGGDGGSGPWGGGNDNGLGVNNASNPHGIPENSPSLNLDPMPRLPPVDSNGPIMLPPPDIRLDREFATIPNINVAEQQSNLLASEQGLRQPLIEIGEIRLAPPASSRPEDDRNFIGYNANGTPLIADRPLGTHSEGNIRPTLYRLPGYASAVQNSILGYDDAGTPYSGVRDANGNLSWYRLSAEETRLIPSRDYLQARDFVNGVYGAARELPRNLLNAGAMIVDGYALVGTGAINTVLGTDMQYPPLSSSTGNMTFDDLGYAIVANSPVGIVAQAGTGDYRGAGESAVNLAGGIAVGEGVAYAMRGAGRVAGQVREFENTIPDNFETFPMPDGPSPNVFEGIANAQREAGLRPYVSEAVVDETTKPGTVTGTEARIRPQDDATTTRSLIRENETADQLAEAGYDVERKPEVPGLKEPDYLVNGDVFDCYAPEPNTSVRNIWSEVVKKINSGQTERVVLNLADSSRSLQEVIGQFSDFPIPGLKELFIFDQNGNLTILNWTKGK